jgi:hypothetical protein
LPTNLISVALPDGRDVEGNWPNEVDHFSDCTVSIAWDVCVCGVSPYAYASRGARTASRRRPTIPCHWSRCVLGSEAAPYGSLIHGLRKQNGPWVAEPKRRYLAASLPEVPNQTRRRPPLRHVYGLERPSARSPRLSAAFRTAKEWFLCWGGWDVGPEDAPCLDKQLATALSHCEPWTIEIVERPGRQGLPAAPPRSAVERTWIGCRRLTKEFQGSAATDPRLATGRLAKPQKH